MRSAFTIVPARPSSADCGPIRAKLGTMLAKFGLLSRMLDKASRCSKFSAVSVGSTPNVDVGGLGARLRCVCVCAPHPAWLKQPFLEQPVGSPKEAVLQGSLASPSCPTGRARSRIAGPGPQPSSEGNSGGTPRPGLWSKS